MHEPRRLLYSATVPLRFVPFTQASKYIIKHIVKGVSSPLRRRSFLLMFCSLIALQLLNSHNFFFKHASTRSGSDCLTNLLSSPSGVLKYSFLLVYTQVYYTVYLFSTCKRQCYVFIWNIILCLIRIDLQPHNVFSLLFPLFIFEVSFHYKDITGSYRSLQFRSFAAVHIDNLDAILVVPVLNTNQYQFTNIVRSVQQFLLLSLFYFLKGAVTLV